MKNKNVEICVIGDSLAYGEGDSEHGGWVQRLRLSLEQSFPEKWIAVHNLGIPGDTTADCLKRMENEMSAREPSLVLIAVGMVDSRYHGNKDNNKTPIDQFATNITKLIGVARRFVYENIICVGLTKVNEKFTQPLPDRKTERSLANDVIGKYDEVIKNLCADQKITYVKMADALTNEDLLDGLHPQATGYAKMHDRIKPIVERMIKAT